MFDASRGGCNEACEPLTWARPSQYKNVRPDYLKAIWNVVNWKNVGERLAAAKA